jgi:DNA excision repair protein ERCC-5
MKKNSETGYDFSQLQIQNLVKRNDLTQKFLEVAGITDRHLPTVGGRVAQEKGKTFTLVKSEGDKLGWKLSNKTSAEKLLRAGQHPSSDMPTPIAVSSDYQLPSEQDNNNNFVLNSISNGPSSALKLSSEDFNDVVFTKVDSSNHTSIASQPKESVNETRIKELEAWANYLPSNISKQYPNSQIYHQLALNEWEVDKIKSELKLFEDRISDSEDNLEGLICYTEFLTNLLNYKNQILLEDIPSSPPIDVLDSPSSLQQSFLDNSLLPIVPTSSPKSSGINLDPTNLISSSDVFDIPANIPSDSTFQSGIYSDAQGPQINDETDRELTKKLVKKLIKSTPDKSLFNKREFHSLSPTLAMRINKKSMLGAGTGRSESPTKSKRRKGGSKESSPVLESKAEEVKTRSSSPIKTNLVEDKDDVEIEEAKEIQAELEGNSISEEVKNFAKTNDALNNSANLDETSKLSENLDDSLAKEDTTLDEMTLEMEETLDTEEFLLNLRNKQLPEVSRELRQEIEELSAQAAQQAAKTQEITPQMVEEIYRLLNIMGIPFLLAPSEAEAQCTELQSLGLCQGVITDDSDSFLFGNCTVYRNLFSSQARVECYKSEDIEQHLHLDRKRLIELAMLLGSDYTEGVQGVGLVLALEILAEFDNLKEFKEWWETKVKHNVLGDEGESAIKKRLRSQSSKIYLPDNFPSNEVEQAYLKPSVNSNTQPFKWGEVQFSDLHSFLYENLGWGRDKLKEIIDPVLENREKLKSESQIIQSTLGDFFTKEPVIASKRIKQAVEIMKMKKEEKEINLGEFFSDGIDILEGGSGSGSQSSSKK